MKDGVQTFGRSLLLPIALLAPIGLILGLSGALAQDYMIDKIPFLGNEILPNYYQKFTYYNRGYF